MESFDAAPPPPDSNRQNTPTGIFFLLQFYWVAAIGLFLALEISAEPEKVKVFSFLLRFPYFANNPHFERFSSILSEFITGTAAAGLSVFAVRLMRKQVAFRPYWSAMLVILGSMAYLRPFLVKADVAWATELIRMVLMIIALWGVYRLDVTTAFSVWALSYLVWLAPLFFVEEIPTMGHAGASPSTSVLTEIKSFHTSLLGTQSRLQARQKLLDVIKAQLVEAEKGDVQAQYNLGMIYLDEGGVIGEAPDQALEKAFQWMTKASGQGLVEAQVALGNFYLEGLGIPVTPTQAATLFRAAAGKGSADGEARLGWLYAHGLGVDWNGEEALKRYTTAVRGGSALGLWGLGDLYVTGNGVQRNPSLGMSYYTQAAEKECAPAMAQLGVLMLAGAGARPASDEAVSRIHQAARAGVAQAQYLTMMIDAEGVGALRLPTRARWWGLQLSSAALSGRADAQWYWGRALEEGLMGQADPVQAAAWFSQSAYKGFPAALDSQGDYWAYGLAGERSIDKAMTSYQTAAQFNAKAMGNLILRYRTGIGVPKDPKRSDYYLDQLRLLASRGDPLANSTLGDFCRQGIVLKQNLPQALIAYRQAAENGVGQAYFRLAEMYETGEGVTKDPKAAYLLYRQAAELMYLPAFYNLAVASAEGTGTAKNAQDANAWFLRIQRGAQRGAFAHQLSLARLLERGLFLPRDEAAAAARFQTAALRNDVDAARALAKMIKEGRGVVKNPVLAYCWLDYAVRRGDGRAKRMADGLQKELSAAQRAQAKTLSSNFHPENSLKK